MTGTPDISHELATRTLAVVVHYGDPSLTERCVASILGGTARPGLLIVVDNGPVHVDSAALHGSVVPFRLIRSMHNIGFAAAVNQAVAEGGDFDWIWLLNNDARAEPSALEELLASAHRSGGLALISSLVLDEETRQIWFERARFYPWRLESKHVRVRRARSPDDIDPGRPSRFSIPYLSGCSLLVPRQALDNGGLLDPSFFVYGEDIDLALRASERGWPLRVARRSLVLHRASSGTAPARREFLIAEGSARIVRRRYRGLLPVALAVGSMLGVVRAAMARDPARLTARLSGYRRALNSPPRKPGAT